MNWDLESLPLAERKIPDFLYSFLSYGGNVLRISRYIFSILVMDSRIFIILSDFESCRRAGSWQFGMLQGQTRYGKLLYESIGEDGSTFG